MTSCVCTIVGESMMPTIHDGFIAIINPFCLSIERGDIITFKVGRQTYVKRVVALPGDHIEIKGKMVIVNGELLIEKYAMTRIHAYERVNVSLGSDEYFVLGDNRNDSTDSRMIGPIKRENIKAEVLFTW